MNRLPDKYFLKLAEKWRNQTITAEELKKLEQWYQQNQTDPVEIPGVFAKSEQALGERILREIKQKSGIETTQLHSAKKPILLRMHRYRFFKYAAAVLILTPALLYFLSIRKAGIDVRRHSVTAVQTDIASPGEGAILTLSNGKQIVLEKARGSIAGENGVAIINKDGRIIYDLQNPQHTKSEIVYNTISTPRGKQYQLTLEDGSKVWLNAASSVRFPAVFTGRNRRIELTGEAYLEVVHNDAKPFIVSVNNLEVEVLGTRFDIDSYNDDGYTKTTLAEGKVRAAGNGSSAVLRPGQQAQISHTAYEPIKIVDDVDVEQITAWKEGVFRFTNSNILSIMKQVERWYDVTVKYEVPTENLEFSGYVGKKQNVSQILKIMELTGLVHFKIDGKTITVTK